MTAQPEQVEYLYGIDSSVADDDRFYEAPRVVRFRITKKTPKRIYYIRREDCGRREVGYVNRQEIESAGEAYNRSSGWWAPDFHLYLTAPVLPEYRRRPTLAELRAAMAAAHPDRGGTDAQFIAARARYERARATAP